MPNFLCLQSDIFGFAGTPVPNYGVCGRAADRERGALRRGRIREGRRGLRPRGAGQGPASPASAGRPTGAGFNGSKITCHVEP
ncbi:hypothetical protein GCM10010446_23530 [Streptomyces enissocaesilis]|uniref:Uncharacterized protein n=1 Tax=Streptomyces enissocaesilis TaxID=332589 RepID=A0ABP6JNT5_9ACTN